MSNGGADVNRDEASLAHLMVTSYCAAWFLTDHEVVGDLCYNGKESGKK